MTMETPQMMIGGFNLSEKYDFVSWDDEIPNSYRTMKLMATKPPSSWGLIGEHLGKDELLFLDLAG